MRRRRRSNRAPDDYTPAFEELWSATAMTGSKRRAFEAWWQLDRPAPHVVADAWARWMRLDGWRRGFVPHVVTWLNGRCHEQEPVEVPRRTPEDAARERAQERTRREMDAAVAATDRQLLELRRTARRIEQERAQRAQQTPDAPAPHNGVGTQQGAGQSVLGLVAELAEAKAVR